MLPYFNIITPKSSTKKDIIMQKQQAPTKPKRNKKPEVEVHKFNKKDAKEIKTFSANFNARTDKIGGHDRNTTPQDSVDVTDEFHFHLEDPDLKLNNKLSRKLLSKENEKLAVENAELNEKLNVIQEHLLRKNTKLKEKITILRTAHETVLNENNILKNQISELAGKFNDTQIELESLRHCRKCDDLSAMLEKYKNDLNSTKKNNNELTEDVNMLKNVVYRLNVQLERYQDKLNKHNIRVQRVQNFENDSELKENEQTVNESNLPESHWNHRHTPISWGKVNVNTLGPLLDAYQDTIKEKEDIIQSYEEEFVKFTGKLKDIIRENEVLHKRLNEDDECSKVLSHKLEGLKVELHNAKEQNDLLIKKCALKQDKLEEVLKVYEQRSKIFILLFII